MARTATVQRELHLTLEDIKARNLDKNCFAIKFITSDGNTKGILQHMEGNTSGVVLVGGAGGGYNGPASIYKEMGPDLLDKRISSLRINYRRKNYIEDCVLDTLLGIEFLKSLGVEKIGLVGWSFGGAVVITAGVISDNVRAVATVASQTYGTDHVDRLSPKALLVIHGTGDKTLPYELSEDIHNRAHEPKEIHLYEGANHGVDQNRTEMKQMIENFMMRYLSE